MKVCRQGTGMSPYPPHPTEFPGSQHSPLLHLSAGAHEMSGRHLNFMKGVLKTK